MRPLDWLTAGLAVLAISGWLIQQVTAIRRDHGPEVVRGPAGAGTGLPATADQSQDQDGDQTGPLPLSPRPQPGESWPQPSLN